MDISVEFEQRYAVSITHSGPANLLMRWSLDYQPSAQKGGGNPLTLRGTFDCDTDTLAACAKSAYFDAGTKVILTFGLPGNLASWGGACSGSQPTCEFTLAGDSTVSVNWKY